MRVVLMRHAFAVLMSSPRIAYSRGPPRIMWNRRILLLTTSRNSAIITSVLPYVEAALSLHLPPSARYFYTACRTLSPEYYDARTPASPSYRDKRLNITF